jgi:hypothetical protein
MIPLAASLALAAGLTGSLVGQTQIPDSIRRAAANQPLFASAEPLTIVIEAPFDSIFRERGAESPEFEGKLTVNEGGRAIPLEVQLRTRGLTRLRRDVCEFPPLSVDFDREDVEPTVFAGQNRIKLNVHCQSDRDYEQYVLQEYLAYRIFNLLSDMSFRVRLARVTYVNTLERGDTLTRPAFWIEHQDMLAARNGVRAVNVAAVPPEFTDPAFLALTEVFEYLVGNPDWSAFGKGPGEEECCHNTQPIGDAVRGPVFPVPYDFDVTGLVNTRYADRVFAPAERGLGITRVGQRVYRGICPSRALLPATFQLFNEKRDAIHALYREQAELDPDVLKRSLEYVDEFYETINDPRRAEREIHRRCRT